MSRRSRPAAPVSRIVIRGENAVSIDTVARLLRSGILAEKRVRVIVVKDLQVLEGELHGRRVVSDYLERVNRPRLMLSTLITVKDRNWLSVRERLHELGIPITGVLHVDGQDVKNAA